MNSLELMINNIRLSIKSRKFISIFVFSKKNLKFLNFLYKKGYILSHVIFFLLKKNKRNNKQHKKYFKIFLKFFKGYSLISDVRIIKSIGGFNKSQVIAPSRFRTKLNFLLYYTRLYVVDSNNLYISTNRGIFSLYECYKFNLGGKVFFKII